jgi:hypothetical protein
MIHPLAERWRSQADKKLTAAKGYNSKCSTVKGSNLIAQSVTLRSCADQLEAYNSTPDQPISDKESKP